MSATHAMPLDVRRVVAADAPAMRRAAVVVAACLALAACAGEGPSSAPPTVALSVFEAVEVTRGDVGRVVTLPADVAAWQEVTVHARVAGHVRTMRVDRGDRVKTGDLLVELDAPELEADLARARADLALAGVTAGRVGRAQAKAPDLVVTQNVDQASAGLEVARAAVTRAESLVAWTRLVAPFDGVVTARHVDIGAFVPAATDTASARTSSLLTIADFSRVRVKVAVPERESTFVRPSTPAEVVIGGSSGGSLAGSSGGASTVSSALAASVSRVAWALDPATRTMMAEVDLDNPDRALRPGALAHVRLEVERHLGVPLLPSRAVLVEKGGSSIFTVNAGGLARKVPVRTGFDDGRSVEILDGAAPGTRALLLAGRPPKDGERIELRDATLTAPRAARPASTEAATR